MNWCILCICCTFKEWFSVYCTVFSRISLKCRNFCNLSAYFTKWEYRVVLVIIVSKPKISWNIVWILKKDIAEGWFRDRDLRAQKQGHNCVNLPIIYTENRDPKSLNGPYRYLIPKKEPFYGIWVEKKTLKYGVFP